MTRDICGIAFNEMPNSMWTDNRALTIFDTEDAEQSFRFGTVDIARFVGVFSEFKCAALSVTVAEPPKGKFDLDLVAHPEHVRRFHIDAHHYPIQVGYTEGKTYFPNLQALLIRGECPDSFPDLSGNHKLTQLTIQYDKHFVKRWETLPQINDLTIYDYDEPDLRSLSGLHGVVRLKIVQGKMKSLDGLESLPKLQTLFISTAGKLTDLGAIIRAPHLQNIMFEQYRKVVDWSFLSKNQNLRHLALDTVESVDFRLSLPKLAFLYAKKVATRKNKGFLFETEGRYENTQPHGIDVNYIPDHDAFYQAIS